VLCLGLFDFSRLETRQEPIPESVRELAERRLAARASKNFAESDRLRNLIEKQGYAVRDRADGYELSRRAT
jgi:cysteinyl-tRNA synthetase